MQILGTEVSHSTAATGESIVRLVFQGEGGERIAVDMASDGRDDYPDTEVLERARVMLVQTATFGVGDLSNAASNANLSGADAGVPAAASNGEHYMFEYREGDGSRHAPARLPGIDAVRAEALRCAADLLEDGEQFNQIGWLIRVYDESGALVCDIDAAEAIAEREKAQAAINI